MDIGKAGLAPGGLSLLKVALGTFAAAGLLVVVVLMLPGVYEGSHAQLTGFLVVSILVGAWLTRAVRVAVHFDPFETVNLAFALYAVIFPLRAFYDLIVSPRGPDVFSQIGRAHV